MSEDMSNLMSQINQMLNSDQLPDNIKDMVNNLKNNQEQNSNSEPAKGQNNSTEDVSSNSSMPEFDINTMLKMKKLMDSMNSKKDDPRANLLRSLKPYLKESRKEKVDQYIQLFGMGKVFEMLGPLGGEKKK